MYLTKNIENNSIANVVLNNFGFSNEEKEILFYYNKTGSGNSSMQNLTGSDSAEKIPCIVKKIDAYVDEEKISVDLIKCDVEGAELFVFQGGIETLKKFRPIVFTEMLRKWSALFNYHPNEIIELFVSIGYECFIINNGRLNKILEITEETEETNFIFLFPSKHMF
jgi:FkbM family methyltransferase